MQHIDPVQNEIEESFESIDQDGNHCIEFAEFSGLMRKIDRTHSASALRARFDAIDTNHDGRVTLQEFREWCAPG